MRILPVLLGLVSLVPAAAQDNELPFQATPGPTTGELGDIATITVPAGCAFVEKREMKAFNEFTGNLHNPRDLGALFSQEQGWIAFFSYDPIGYVDEASKDELDAGKLLKEMRRGDDDANRERTRLGLPELTTVGWFQEPFYDPRTNNLTWGLELESGGERIINHQIRLLGRGGVMNVVVVDQADSIATSIAAFEPLLSSYEFTSGNRYAEFRQGDKVAKLGLAALVLGGGAAVAAKAGLFAKLGKFLKPILIGIVALVAAVGRRIAGLFGRRRVGYDGQHPGP